LHLVGILFPHNKSTLSFSVSRLTHPTSGGPSTRANNWYPCYRILCGTWICMDLL